VALAATVTLAAGCLSTIASWRSCLGYRLQWARQDNSLQPYHEVLGPLYIARPEARRPPLRPRALTAWSPPKTSWCFEPGPRRVAASTASHMLALLMNAPKASKAKEVASSLRFNKCNVTSPKPSLSAESGPEPSPRMRPKRVPIAHTPMLDSLDSLRRFSCHDPGASLAV